VPPLPYLLVLSVAVAAIAWMLARERPAITAVTVVGLAPWMVVGAALHALLQTGGAPDGVAPLLGTPAVYFATLVPAGATWVVAARRSPEMVPKVLGVAGGVAALPPVIAVFASAGRVRPGLSLVSVAIAVVLAGACWVALARVSPEAVATTGSAGLLVVFAHALDGASTAVGVDLLQVRERTPLSAAILEFSGALPTADLLGAGWLFVLVKLALAGVILNLFAGYVREDPRRAHVLLAFIAAVGLGPGAHNVILFAVR